MTTADVIVVGLGAMGSAAAYQLARRGARVLGFDRHSPPHDRGSSHGETRITRQAIGEGQAYVPFALRAHEIWRELEAETGQRLLRECGVLVMGRPGGAACHGKDDFAGRTIAAARAYGIPHEVLDARQVAERFPQFMTVGDETACFEPGGGLVYPERCVAAQLDLARRHGAALRLDEPVLRLEPSGGGVRAVTARGSHEGGQAIVAAGGWTPGLVGGPMAGFRLHRQALHWFRPERAADYAPDRFPCFIWAHGLGQYDSFYGFPLVPDGTPGVKVATETYVEALDRPEAMVREVSDAEAEAMHRDHVAGKLRSLGPDRLRSAACFYTVTPDSDFVVDRHPEHEAVLLVSACSGHGFKHSPAVGEAAAEVIFEGVSRTDLSAFSLARLG